MRIHKLFSLVVVAALPLFANAAGDHGAHGAASTPMTGMKHGDEHASMAGKGGDPAKVGRTIAVEMNDSMRFTPDKITVKAGETVRFFLNNKGKATHEMVLGTAEEIEEHAAMMRKMGAGMAHKDANQISLAPGQRGAIVWQFAKAGTVNFACLVPGHKEAGMVGTIAVQ